MRYQSFPFQTNFDWKEKVEESLKGKLIQTLETSTYENITLKPLYTREDEKVVPDFPGAPDFRRGNDPLGYINKKWNVAQHISYQTPSELLKKLEKGIERGLTALSFELTDPLFEEEHSLLKIINEFNGKYPFAIDAKAMQFKGLKIFSQLQNEESQKISGYVASDPISLFAVDGHIPANSEKFFADWVELILEVNQKVPNLRTILINTSVYHNGGANAIQELAVAASTGVSYLQQLLDNGVELTTALSKMVFQFSIGSNFFMEIAKLRAARIIWSKILEVYGADGDLRGMQISAQTSSFTKSIYDPHVNLLRSGNEAFAAVIGGIQYLHVTPLDQMTNTTPHSERIAQNTQLILQEEVNLQKVIDPSGGSWYVEELTRELAEKAWTFFKEIEKAGGMLEVLRSNWLQKEISSVNEKRQQDIFTRKASIIGTNVYTNLDDRGPKCCQCENEPTSSSGQSDGIKIDAIPQSRLSQPYEDLRIRAEELESQTGSKPLIGLICLGSLKQYKTRADFIRGFLAAGGIRAVESDPIMSIESITRFVQECKSNYFCLCGSNEQYDEIGHEILQFIKDEFPGRIIYLAGLPEKEVQTKWLSEGITSFIHVKSNCYDTLKAILSGMEVSLDAQPKA
jgi:methylmalonyl-CoA mutase